MDFRLDDQQLALQDSVAAFGGARYPLDEIGQRAGVAIAATEPGWREVFDQGVFSIMVAESKGGAGLGMVEAALVFEQLGRRLVPGPILWTTLATTLLPDLADRAIVVSGHDASAVAGDPIVVEHAAELDKLLVLRPTGVFVVDQAELDRPDPLDPLDPLTPVGRFHQLPAGTAVGGVDELAEVRAQGTVLAAAMLVGVADAALEVARDYALERHQFDRPIGSFQALKHMMADMYVRTGLARSSTYAAAAVLDDPAVGDARRSISAAKLLAGEAAVDNARAAVQILGGMGFTWDMPPNYLLKRAWLLENTFGTARSHGLEISSCLERETADRTTTA